MDAQGPRTPSAESVAEPAIQHDAGKKCRVTAGISVRAFLDLLEEASVDGLVSMDAARRIGAAILSARGPLAEHYSASENACDAAFTLQRIERQRVDFLGRLIAQPFSYLLDDQAAGIERKHLTQLFAAVRMMVGEETHEDLRHRAALAAERHRTPEAMVDWPAFYEDAEAMAVFEQVLVTIARSFRRFEPRKDWFLIVMNSNPSTVSVAPNVFIAKKPEDKVLREFSEAHMCRLFKALFATHRPETFDPARRKAFTEQWGTEPDKVFGPLFVELLALCNQAGV
jgi:hypothetical protein